VSGRRSWQPNATQTGVKAPRRARRSPWVTGTGELDPLRERPIYLRSLRALLAVTVIIYAALLSQELRTSVLGVAALSAGYVLVTFGVEAVSRWRTGGFHRWLFWLALAVDGAFLAAATYLSGGSTGPVRYLVLVYLTVINLLGSWQTGLATAVWQSATQLAFFLAQRDHALGGFGGSTTTGREWDRFAAFLAALWVLTIVTALLSAMNHRDLRRRRYEVDRLVDLGRDLENAEDASTVGELLLVALGDAFGFDRMVLFEVVQDVARPLVTSGVSAAPGPCQIFDASVVNRAIVEARTMRVDTLDEAADPWLAATMPSVSDLAVLPLAAEGVVGVLVIALGRWARGDSEQRVITASERFAGHAALALRSAELLARVRQLAITDGLTQLANRRAFDRALEREIGRAARADGRLSLVLIDVDNFKSLNDEFGHVMGDTVLRQISRALARSVRSYDTIARYGGEEFAAVLPGCSAGLAFTLADRLRVAVQDAPSDIKVTASVGVATYPYDGAESTSLLRSADRALYASKRAGRNRVRSAEQARVELPDT
jgi:diguanylate cyclase (GGDEF)-like protein